MDLEAQITAVIVTGILLFFSMIFGTLAHQDSIEHKEMTACIQAGKDWGQARHL